MNRWTFFSLLLLAGTVFVGTSCDSPKNAMDKTPPPSAEVAEETMDEIPQEPVSTPPVIEGPRTVVGAFKSVRGVMDPLSCYCDNGGYIDSPAGEHVAVCFNSSEDVSSTDFIKVTGVMTTKTIDANGVCPAGTMSYLVVESYSLQPE